MSRLRSGLANLGLVVASLLMTLGLVEVVLRFLPVAWAPPVHVPTAQDPIIRYQANTPFTWSIGWNFDRVVHDRTNAQGFIADYDYDRTATTPLVAVIGDSFIEAMQVPFAQSLTGRLQHDLDATGRAYAFAISGAGVSQYVAYARHACAIYRPQRLVFNVVGNDFDESLYEHRKRDGLYNLHKRPDGTFDWTLTPVKPPSLLERIARNSALALYLARNVGVARLVDAFSVPKARAQGAAYVGNTDAAATHARIAEGYAVIEWLLDTLDKLCVKPSEIVLSIDAPRPQLYDDAALAQASKSYFAQMRTRLIERARARGFVVVDLLPAFRSAYARHHHRFEHPADNHWNEAGHAVAAQAVYDALKDWAPLAGR